MSRLLPAILFLCFSLSLGAQPQGGDQAPYYYFGHQKVLLKESPEKFYVRLSENQAAAGMRVLNNKLKIPAENLMALANERLMVINLGNKDEALARKLFSSLKEIQAEIVRPVLNMPDGTELAIDEGFYVKLRLGVTYKQFENLAIQKKCSFNKFNLDDRTYFLKAGRQNNFDGLAMANVFYESGLFEFAEPNFQPLKSLDPKTNKLIPAQLPDTRARNSNFKPADNPPVNDPGYPIQWSLKNLGGNSQFSSLNSTTATPINGTAGADIEIEDAWAITMGQATIRIAVIDDGVNPDHPDLINNIDPMRFGIVNGGDGKPGSFIDTANSHGTFVAGIIASEANNGIGVAGVAPICKIVPVNVTVNKNDTYGTFEDLRHGIDWAWDTAKVDIINCSWGNFGWSSLVTDAIHRAVTQGRNGKGTIIIFCTMNENAGVAFPGVWPETIAVGAMSMCYERKSPSSCDQVNVWGSDYGVGLDVSAPGAWIVSTAMDFGKGNSYFWFDGTSSATPIVSGVAALVLSAKPDLTQQQARVIIEKSTRKVGAYIYDRAEGQPNGTWTSEMGYGLVSAKNAVMIAQNNTPLCNVVVERPATLQTCSGSGITLNVTNGATGNTYKWRKDGTDITNATGTIYSATQSGAYDVVLKTQSGCEDTSYKFNVVISAPDGALQADAGADTTIAVNSKIFLGGGPAGKGGTGIEHSMRGFFYEYYSNQLWRFDPKQPVLRSKLIKSGFKNPNNSSDFYSGAASTPFGLYMVAYSRKFVKIDTATGNAFDIGLISGDANLHPNAMTYDPITGKILVVGSRSSSNELYEINPTTGAGTFLGTVTGSGYIGYSTIIGLGADNSNGLYGFQLSYPQNTSAKIISIDKTTLVATIIGDVGFAAQYLQDAAVDPLTNEFYHISGYTTPLARTSAYNGKGLWKINKTTGQLTLVGSVAQPWNVMDALAFANKEYKYEWSPAANLSNPNDANPQFTAIADGVYNFTLQVTDLCGNKATDQVTITVGEAMPVTLVNFSGRIQNNISYLKWTVEQELNFDKYEIERSIDGTSFSAIGSVKSNGTGTKSEYTFNDDNLPQGAGIIYYRLKMVDLDGSFKNSDVIKLRNDQTLQNRLISISPNPFAGSFTLKYESNRGTTMQVFVTDSKGQQVLRKVVELQTGINQFNIDGTTLSKGIYFVRLQTDQDVTTQKIIKQ